MSDFPKAVSTAAQADVKKVEAEAAALKAAAGQAMASAPADEKAAQGWLRRNVWGVLGAVVVLAIIVVWVLVR